MGKEPIFIVGMPPCNTNSKVQILGKSKHLHSHLKKCCLFLICPKGKCFLGGNSKYRRTVINAAHQKIFWATLKTLGLVDTRNNLPEWQAVKSTFFVPWTEIFATWVFALLCDQRTRGAAWQQIYKPGEAWNYNLIFNILYHLC